MDERRRLFWAGELRHAVLVWSAHLLCGSVVLLLVGAVMVGEAIAHSVGIPLPFGIGIGLFPTLILFALTTRGVVSAVRRPSDLNGAADAYLRALRERARDLTPDDEQTIATVCAEELSVMLDLKHAVCFVASDQSTAETLTELLLAGRGHKGSSEDLAGRGSEDSSQGERLDP